ncbi:hypothetical protein [Streptomyces laurentii]|uniref:hypothetical protein n=1 Tax=Streptomyces laurentii TaxID=39478 RepID=UPI0033EF92D8
MHTTRLPARARTHHTPRPYGGRALARFLPALLYALCVFLAAPAPAPASASAHAAASLPAPLPASAAAAAVADGVSAAPADDPHPHTTGPTSAASAAEAAELPAAVEHTVRFPAPPAAPPLLRTAGGEPVRGRVEADPRRERAPPGLPYDPQAPRGPPSTRHS